MVEPVGPVYAGGFETIVTGSGGERYEILYFPDLHNSELQAEGKAPVYYWLPNAVRVARAGDAGDYKFNLLHFVGVLSSESTVGVAGTQEVTGGVLSLTVTSAPPLNILQAAHQQLSDRMRADSRAYWSWHTPVPPHFQPVIVSDSRTQMSSLSPRLDGSLPVETPPAPRKAPTAPPPIAAGGGPGAHGAIGAPPGGAGAPAGGTRTTADPGAALRPRRMREPRTVRVDRDATGGSNLDMWYMRIEGQGPGSINPAGEHAYVALCGALPTAILWQGFHGAYSPVSVSQTLNLKMWSETLRIKIRGNWDRIFSHFSAAAKGRSWWFDADIKAEFNNLRINGGITVEIEIDGTNPGADKMKEEVDKRVDLIVSKFTEQAKARIFDPAPPDVKPAEASSSGGGILGGLFGFGGGFALKYRRDETKLDLGYDETRQERFNLPMTISSTLEGFYNAIKADPAAERKYFTTLYLEDWDRKIGHTVKPVANWPAADGSWVGDPVSFMGVQIGYPSARGDIQWLAHVFQSTDTGEATSWQTAVAKKNASDVMDAPAGWTPDVSYVKRTVHFLEPPAGAVQSFHHCFIEQQVVDLDPEPNGTATKDMNLEVRADNAGKFDLGPINLDRQLRDDSQMVDVEFQAAGKTVDGTERPIHTYRFKNSDQDTDRRWTIFTGQKDFVPNYRYRVHVVVMGDLFSDGQAWSGPWVESSGIGAKTIHVPKSTDAGVVVRGVPRTAAGTTAPSAIPAASAAPAAAGPGAGAHPVTRGPAAAPTPATATIGPPPATREPARAAGRTVGGFSVSPTPKTESTPAGTGGGATTRYPNAPKEAAGTRSTPPMPAKARSTAPAPSGSTSAPPAEARHADEPAGYAEASEEANTPPVTAGWTSVPPKSNA
ncbi:hypothetical protein ACFRCG_44015 [Embleya sp. NPDC056575]|uniref:hypothetical protein n=1 Tax=unclassified Embleya TaxID=2699296 RepID=UPI003682F059